MKLIATKSRLGLVLIVITIGVLCITVQSTGETLDEKYRPGSVRRRASNDYVYQYQHSESYIRCRDNYTYVVEEHRCVQNENFFDGKSATASSLAILQLSRSLNINAQNATLLH